MYRIYNLFWLQLTLQGYFLHLGWLFSPNPESLSFCQCLSSMVCILHAIFSEFLTLFLSQIQTAWWYFPSEKDKWQNYYSYIQVVLVGILNDRNTGSVNWKLRRKSEFHMGYESTILHDQARHTNHWATRDSTVSKSEMWVFDCIMQSHSQFSDDELAHMNL